MKIDRKYVKPKREEELTGNGKCSAGKFNWQYCNAELSCHRRYNKIKQ